MSRASAMMVALVLAVGVGLRLRVYLANRSLWLDEAFLALNIAERDFGGLARPLAGDQAAPLGFLFVERLIVILVGSSEYALRAFPLAAGIAALFLFWRLAAAYLRPPATVLALAVFALSEPLIYYSAEVKQYGVDVAVTVALWIAFVGLGPRLRQDHPGAWAVVGVVGALAFWFSHPAVFVVGAIGLRWLWQTLRAVTWRSVIVRGPVGLVWAASFGASYLIALRGIDDGTMLHEMWASMAAPLIPRSTADLQWYVRLVYSLALVPFGPALAKVVSVACAGGIILLWSRHRDQFWWVTGATGLAILASALGQYPLAARLWLFLAPITILLLAVALEGLWRRTPRLAPAAAVVMLVPSLVTAGSLALRPPEREEIRPVLRHVRDHYRPGDRLYLYASAGPAVSYYASRGLVFPGEVVIGEHGRGDVSVYERDAERLRGAGRTWVVFSHVRRFGGVDEEAQILGVLDRIGTRISARRETGASAYLYAL